MNPLTFFERVVLINLDSRPERLEACRKRFCAPAWPFREPERVRAVAGKLAPWPNWWKSGGGAWGVYRTNVRIIEDCLLDKTRNVLILEDDAAPCEGFAEKVERYLNAVPNDWQMLYLGGQVNHYDLSQYPPRKVNAEVMVPWSVNRLHAYAINQAGMKILYRHLTSHKWQPKHHIDHHIEVLQRAHGIRFYAPTEWLIAQGDGRSDICGRELPMRFFDKRDRANKRDPVVVAVLGPYSGGTSAVAGACHHLGLVMGHAFFEGGKKASPKGCFEAKRLFDICMACYPEPRFDEGRPYQRRVELLRGWMNGRRNDKSPFGAKHPKLCLMVPEMLEAWPGCKFIVVQRPIEASVQSLRKRGWWQPAQDPEELIRRLVDTRDREIAKVDQSRVLYLQYDALVESPRPILTAIAKWAGISPSEEQYRQAIEQIDPGLRHFHASE